MKLRARLRTVAAAIRPAILSGSIAALAVFSAQPARAQTYTSASSLTFTNALAWNFGAGPVPASDPALALTFQTFGTGAITAANDLNLTLNTLNLATSGMGALTLSSLLGGGFAFAGGAGKINLLGSGAGTALSAPVVLGSGLTSLTFDGAGASGLTISGVIASNTGTGAPLIIATDAGNSLAGTVALSGTNTFSGGVVLTSGALSLGSARALGDRANTLTINGGILRGSNGAAVSVANNITLNSTLLYASTSPAVNPTTLTGVLSGVGGVTNAANGSSTSLGLTGINTYSGATTVRGLDFALAANDGAGIITINGAVGSILNSSAINIGEGGEFRLNYNLGNTATNTRVSTGTAITSTGGFLEVIGNTGVIKQSLGTVNAGGLTTLLAATNGAITPAAGAATEVTVSNLVRSTGGTVTFAGPNLGGAAVAAGLGAALGNVILTQINGAAPGTALVGGGGAAGSTTISILPWALGDAATTVSNFGAGTGFVTYGANGVRLLNAITGYNTSNNFTTVGATENVRITGGTTDHTVPTTVNSLYFALSDLTLGGGSNPLTITSGALASNVALAFISNPVRFGAAGAGEGIVSVVGALTTTNRITLSGTVTAGSLVKSGHGTLVLSGSSNAIAGGITVNGGQISVAAVSQLGGATGLTFNGQSYAASRAGLTFTHFSGTETLTAPVVVNGGIAGFTVADAAATLAVNSDISGAGGVGYDGAGTKIPGGTNTYTGGTYLGAGSLQLSSDAVLGSNAPTNFLGLAGGTLQLTGAWISARAISVNGTVVLDTQANNASLSGPIIGTSALTKLGAGTLGITGADNGYGGTITLGNSTTAGGILALTGAGALNSGRVTFGPAAAGVAGTYRLDLSGATAPSGTPWRSLVALNTGSTFAQAHTVQLGASGGAPVDLCVDSGAFGGAAGVIAGFGKLVKVGTGTLSLNGGTASTFTGGVEVRGGTLTFSADNQLGNSANAITLAGGTLQPGGNSARNLILAATPVPMTASTGFAATLPNVITNSTTISLSGLISGAGGFAKNGSGTLSLTGALPNTYAGDTQIIAGFLSITDNNQLGAASSRLRLNGGRLVFAAAPGGPNVYNFPRTVLMRTSSSLSVTSALATLDFTAPLIAPKNLFPPTTLSVFGSGAIQISNANRSFFGTINSNLPIKIAVGGGLRGGSISGSLDIADQAQEFSGLSATVALGSSGSVRAGSDNNSVDIGGTGGAGTSITKVGLGSLGFTAALAFSGNLNLISASLNGVTLANTGSSAALNSLTLGGLPNTAANTGVLFTLDNAGANSGTRLADTQAIHSNSSEFVFRGNASTLTSETAGSLRGAGQTTVTLPVNGGALNFGDASNGLTRLDRGTFLFRAGNANLGSAAATTTIANLTFGNSAGLELVGGGGAAGTTTISILPYATGGTTATDAGSTFVTYGANGVRPLNTTTEFKEFSGASPTDNILTAAGTTFGVGGTTVSSLIMGTDAFLKGSALEITSGALLNTASNVFFTLPTVGNRGGVDNTELRTGAVNSRELTVSTVGDLAIYALVTTTGGLTKSGAANLFLANTANTYTGQTTVNAGVLVIDDKAALGGSTSLVIGGGFLKYRGADTTLTGFTVKAAGGASAGLGSSAGFHLVSGSTLDLAAGSVSGNGGILKDGTGVLKLTGTNTHSGTTVINGGALAIDGAAALGTNSRVIFGTGLSTSGGQTLRFDAPMTLTQDFGVNSLNVGIGFGFDTNGNAVTLSGTMLDARDFSIRGLYKFGAGELNLTATEMYTGPTQIFGGTLRLSGANGSIVNSTGTEGFSNTATVLVNPGTALVLDNSGSNNNNRLPDVWDTPFAQGNVANSVMRVNGGEFKIIGNASGTSERINQFDILTGTVTLSGGGTTLTSGLLNRTTGTSAGLIRGTNLGAAPSATSANWFLTDLGGGGVQLGGAGGAESTPFVNILPGFVGDTSAAGSGTDFLTYAVDTGFRRLTGSEYSGTIPANNLNLTRAPNVALTGAATVNQTTAISALKLGAGASLGGSGTLLLGQSTVLATGNASIDVPSLSSNVTGANAGYVFLTSGAATTLTVGSTLPGAGLTTYGEGTVKLSGGYIGTGGITVGQGTLKLDGATAALTPIGSAVNVMPGAIFDLGGMDRVIARLTTTAAIGTFNMGQVSNGTVALGANRLTLYDLSSSTFTGNIAGAGGLTKSRFSTGTSTFTQPLSYFGSTLVRGGTLRLAGAATLASTAVELRNGTLEFNNSDDNAATGGYIADRIGAGTPFTLAGGTILFTENVNTTANHHLGPIALEGTGALTITQTSTTAPSTTTIADLTRAASRGTFTVTADSLGLAQNPTGGARIFLTQIDGAAPASAMIGGSGGVGTTTQKILPWAYAGTAVSFLTYGADGLRPIATSEFAASLTAAGATENVRIVSSQALVAPVTVNALRVSGGDVTGAFDLTLTSGALLISSAAPTNIGDSTRTLLTGDAGSGPNSRELVVCMPGTGPHVLNYNVTTSGGMTKFGSQPLTLGGTANTFTGGLNINEGTLLFRSDAQLGATGGVVRFGGLTSFLTFAGTTAATIEWNRPVETTAQALFSNDDPAIVRWNFRQPISGPGGVTYSRAGSGSDPIFTLNAANSYTGRTAWFAGDLHIGGDSDFGNGGELVIGASSLSRSLVLHGDWNSSRVIHASGTTNAGSIQTNGFSATWSGQLIGDTALAKNGAGALILTEAVSYSGALTVNAGEVRLKDRGSIAANASARNINAGAALTLDDSGAHFSDRLHDSTGGTILSGGEFKILGSSTATTEEVIFGLNANAASASTVTVAAGSGQAGILRVAGTLAVNAGTSLWRGTNLGVNAPGTANSATVILTETNALQQSGLAGVTFLTGGAAPAGNPSVSVIKGAFGDTSATGLGTQLVTYDFDKGVRLLNPATEFTPTLINGSVVTDNVKADGTALPLANATTANALWLSNAASVTGAGTVTLTAGNLLVTGTGNTIANPITAGANALAIGGPGDVTLSGAISGTGGLIKMGAGMLTLPVANGYTGNTILAAGTVAVGSATAFNTTAVQFQGGAIQNSTAGPLTLANNLTLNGPMLVSGAQNLTFSGTVSLANATREINVSNSGITTLSGVISSSQLLINYGLTKTGPGLLVLSKVNTYDGETTVNGGELRISGSISASTLTTVVSGTLSGTGTVGALKIVGGTLAPGANVGTLNSGDVDFSGGTFSIEIGSGAVADMLAVTGSAGLSANTALTLSLLGGYDPAGGDSWKIIDNDGADAFALGAFRFISGGSPVEPNVPFLHGGREYALSYAGGTGNDVILAVVPEAGTLALIAGTLPAMLLRRRRRVQR